MIKKNSAICLGSLFLAACGAGRAEKKDDIDPVRSRAEKAEADISPAAAPGRAPELKGAEDGSGQPRIPGILTERTTTVSKAASTKPGSAPAPAPAGEPRCEFSCPGDMYCGFSLVTVSGADLGQAIAEVRKKARNDLAKSIRVWIKSEMHDQVVYTRSGKEEVFEEKVASITETYVDMGLEGVKVRHEIDDLNGRVCAFATLSRAGYQENVAGDLSAKVGRIQDAWVKHEELLARGDPSSAVKSLLAAGKWLAQDFGDIPVKAVLAGREQEAHAAIGARLSYLIGRLSVSAVDRTLPFGADGKVKGQVDFAVKYAGQTGDEPAANLAVAFAFVKGQGRVVPDGVTGRLGNIEARVERVDPGAPRAVLRAQLLVPGLQDVHPGLRLPFADVELYKVPVVALLVYTGGGGAISGLEDQVKSIVADRGFELTDAPGGIGMEPSSGDFTKLKDRGADNLLVIKVEASGSQPSRADLAVGKARATVSIYSVTSRKLLASRSLQSGRGYGASVPAARWKAISMMKGKLYEVVGQELKKHLSK